MNEKTLSLPPYSAGLFVDREAEVGLIEGMARQMSRGEAHSASSRTVIIRGQRGAGKTWLSQHLHRTILPKILGVDSLLISLFPPPEGYQIPENSAPGEWFISREDFSNPKPEALTLTILTWAARTLGFPFAQGDDLKKMSSVVEQGFKDRLQQRILVLILDSVFETSWDFLGIFEQWLLSFLSASPNVLIVMTGRGRMYPWVSPYLRMGVEERLLGAFSQEHIAVQVQCQTPDSQVSADEIFRLGGGYPINNYYLAQGMNQVETLDAVAQMLLSVVPSRRQTVIRQYFEALCVLDGFRDDEIPYMLAAYYNDNKFRLWDRAQIRELREELISTHLVRWEEGRFIMDDSIRLILDNYLSQKEGPPLAWQRLNCEAYQLYLKWAEDFPKYKEYYTNKAGRYAQALQHSGFDPQACAASPTQADIAAAAQA